MIRDYHLFTKYDNVVKCQAINEYGIAYIKNEIQYKITAEPL